MIKDPGPYIIVKDNDGHAYVIPFKRKLTWYAWFETQDYEDGIVPEFAEEIGGNISSVQFNNYKIGV